MISVMWHLDRLVRLKDEEMSWKASTSDTNLLQIRQPKFSTTFESETDMKIFSGDFPCCSESCNVEQFSIFRFLNLPSNDATAADLILRYGLV